MKLSIFPDVKPLPSKSEKAKESKYASNPYLPKIVEVSTDEDLINFVTSNAWSPFVFDGPRLRENFVSTDFLVLDVDQGLSIEESEKRIEESGFACLCVTTTSHKKDNHRYRLILPLSRTITLIEDFEASIKDLMEAFPESDPACKDPARFFFGSTLEDGFWIEGSLLEPIKAAKEEAIKRSNRPSSESKIPVDASISDLVKELYGQDREFIPECVNHFINEAHTGLPGTWVCDLNRFSYVLSLQNIEEDVIFDVVSHLAPDNLDKRDIDCITRAIRDGIRDREEE